jgi:hypothetical protein
VVLVVKEMEDDEMVCLRMMRNGEGGELKERGVWVKGVSVLGGESNGRDVSRVKRVGLEGNEQTREGGASASE